LRVLRHTPLWGALIRASATGMLLGAVVLANAQSAEGSVRRLQEQLLVGDYAHALRLADRLIEEASKPDPELLYWRGMALLKLVRPGEAAAEFEKALDTGPSRKLRARITLALSDAELAAGRFSEARRAYRRYMDNYPHGEQIAAANLGMGRAHLKEGNWSDAEAALKETGRRFPGTFEAAAADELLKAGLFFTVQVGTFSQKENAEEVIHQLQSSGYAAYLMPHQRSDRVLWRVQVGKVHTRAEVLQVEGKLRAEGLETIVHP
jgi:tetratricopeptide (TPR) repeat protein